MCSMSCYTFKNKIGSFCNTNFSIFQPKSLFLLKLSFNLTRSCNSQTVEAQTGYHLDFSTTL